MGRQTFVQVYDPDNQHAALGSGVQPFFWGLFSIHFPQRKPHNCSPGNGACQNWVGNGKQIMSWIAVYR